MTDNEYSKARKAAVDALIYWAKTGMREFTMRDAVNDYLEASGANGAVENQWGLVFQYPKEFRPLPYGKESIGSACAYRAAFRNTGSF